MNSRLTESVIGGRALSPYSSSLMTPDTTRWARSSYSPFVYQSLSSQHFHSATWSNCRLVESTATFGPNSSSEWLQSCRSRFPDVLASTHHKTHACPSWSSKCSLEGATGRKVPRSSNQNLTVVTLSRPQSSRKSKPKSGCFQCSDGSSKLFIC